MGKLCGARKCLLQRFSYVSFQLQSQFSYVVVFAYRNQSWRIYNFRNIASGQGKITMEKLCGAWECLLLGCSYVGVINSIFTHVSLQLGGISMKMMDLNPHLTVILYLTVYLKLKPNTVFFF